MSYDDRYRPRTTQRDDRSGYTSNDDVSRADTRSAYQRALERSDARRVSYRQSRLEQEDAAAGDAVATGASAPSTRSTRATGERKVVKIDDFRREMGYGGDPYAQGAPAAQQQGDVDDFGEYGDSYDGGSYYHDEVAYEQQHKAQQRPAFGQGAFLGLYGGGKGGPQGSGGSNRRGAIFGGSGSGGGNLGNGMYGGAPQRSGLPPIGYILIALAIVVIVVLCVRQFACGGIFGNAAEDQGQSQSQSELTQSSESNDSNTAEQAQQSANISSNGEYQEGLNVTIKVSAVGDCTLGTDADLPEENNFTKVFSETNSTTYFFNNVTNFLNNDQISICNFEGVLSSSGEATSDSTYTFRGPKKYASILSDGSIEAANLANDHSFDYGDDAYEDTKSALADANVTNFGFDRVGTYSSQGVLVGFFGVDMTEHDYDEAYDLVKEDIADLQEKDVALCIGYFHWGEEGNASPTSDQVKLAHAAIDEGCDLVLGSHPHVVQGVERYNNRYIAYSLGNFCYGGNDNPSEYNTMIFQQTFSFENGRLVISDEALSDVDVVPCSVSSSSSINNYQPTPLKAKAAKSMLATLNERSKALEGDGTTFAAKINDDGVAKLAS